MQKTEFIGQQIAAVFFSTAGSSAPSSPVSKANQFMKVLSLLAIGQPLPFYYQGLFMCLSVPTDSPVVFHQHQIKISFTGPDLQSFGKTFVQIKSCLPNQAAEYNRHQQCCSFVCAPLIAPSGTLYVCVPTLFTCKRDTIVTFYVFLFSI